MSLEHLWTSDMGGYVRLISWRENSTAKCAFPCLKCSQNPYSAAPIDHQRAHSLRFQWADPAFSTSLLILQARQADSKIEIMELPWSLPDRFYSTKC